jgi:histone H2A
MVGHKWREPSSSASSRSSESRLLAERIYSGLVAACSSNARGTLAKKHLSWNDKAGVLISLPRVHQKLKSLLPNTRVRRTSTVYMAAVLEYLAAEVLELAGSEALNSKKLRTRIAPRHIHLGVHSDEELEKLLKGVTVNPLTLSERIDDLPL